MGGTFDPIHCGHLEGASAAETALGLTELLVVPSNVPPHRPPPAASSYHRFAMVSLAVAGRPGWRASDLELRDNARSFTSTTFRACTDKAAPAGCAIVSAARSPRSRARLLSAILDSRGWRSSSDRRRRNVACRRMVVRDRRQHREPSIILLDAPTPDVINCDPQRRLRVNQSQAAPRLYGNIEQHGLYSSTPERRARPLAPAAGRLHG